MSAMSDLAYDIEQLYIDGLSARQIADQLNCELSLVVGWLTEQGVKPFDQWSDSAQSRLISDLYNPFNTINS